MSIRNELLERLASSEDSLTISYDIMEQNRLAVSPISLTEATTFEGRRFYGEFDAELSSSETKYIMYQMPSAASNRIIALQSRSFKSLNGAAEIEILWNSTGVVLGAQLPTFNENRNIPFDATMTINEVVSVVSDGTVRERDFLQGVGSGNNSSGAISSDLGFRLYSPDSFFIAKITNLETQVNRIHISYTWLELKS